jgi:4-hydroxy-3-methylbut-2-enyl diphosphate reductase
MNRSVERRCLSVRGTHPGELTVGWFVHPTRGRVRCPATPLVATSLRGRGHRVREEHDLLVPADGNSDGVLFTASYVDSKVGAVGLAVAAHEMDRAARRAAREVVLAWSATWRSRRLVLAAAAYCGANEHGTTDECPHVAAAHRNVRRFVCRGDRVVVVGRRDEPVSTRLADPYAEVVLVESAEDVAGLRLTPDRVSYLVAPGIALEHALRVVGTLRARYPQVRGPHPDDFCYSASDHLATVRDVATSCDQVLVLGAATAADTTALVNAITAARRPVHVVDHLERIRPSWLAGAESIGIATAPSAPPLLLHTVVDALSGLGPVSVACRRVTTDLVDLDSWPRSVGVIDKASLAAQMSTS